MAFWGQRRLLLPAGEVRGIREAGGNLRGTGAPDTGDCSETPLSAWEPAGKGSVAPGLRQTGQPEGSGRVDAETLLKRPGEAEVRADRRLPA
jgi:hypothetical protein